MKTFRSLVVTAGVVFVSLTLQGCHHHPEETQEHHDDGTGQLMKLEDMPILGPVFYHKCNKKQTGEKCVHVVYKMSYRDLFHKLQHGGHTGHKARTEFRDNFLTAVKKFGQDEVSIEFMPVNQHSQAITPTTYRLFHAPSISTSPLDDQAFTGSHFQGAKVHIEDNNPELVSAFLAPATATIIAPVMRAEVHESRRQHFRSFVAFMQDDAIKDYQDAFLKKWGQQFYDDMRNTADKSGNAVYMASEGMEHVKHHKHAGLGQNWAHIRMDHSKLVHGLGYAVYHSEDWKQYPNPEDYPQYIKAHATLQMAHDRDVENARAHHQENKVPDHPAHTTDSGSGLQSEAAVAVTDGKPHHHHKHKKHKYHGYDQKENVRVQGKDNNILDGALMTLMPEE